MNELTDNYLAVLRNWSNFGGRARRREYWMFFLGNIIVGLLLGIASGLLGRLGAAVFGLWYVVQLVPTITVGIRRLHDTGRSGWWILLALTGIGSFILLFFFVQDGQPGVNEYGPNPKESAFAYA